MQMGSFTRLLLLLLSCFSFSAFLISDAKDSITASESLTDGKTIVSSGGTFELGFFSPGDPNNLYLGIWYKKISVTTVVWVANRDVPLSNSSGILEVTDQGVLRLRNSENRTVWFSNSTRVPKNPVVAQLLESGNLVLKDAEDDDPENYLWQSFDYPGNTLLPGMKHGVDLVSGIDRYLQSWKSSSDPSRGDFIFRVDTHGFPQQFLMNGSAERFRSGPWNGLRFSGSPGLRENPIYTFKFVLNQQEVYYSFDLRNASVYSRLVLHPDGVLRRVTWNYRTQGWTTYLSAPADNCDNYETCHAFGKCDMANSPVCNCLDKFVPRSPKDYLTADFTSGCIRRTPLNCKKGDGFLKYKGIKLPDTRHSWYNQSMSLKECEKLCLKDCSCQAYANTDIRGKGSGCLLWFDDLTDITELGVDGQDIYIRMASSEIGTNMEKLQIIRISLSVIAGVLLLSLILIFYIRVKKKKGSKQQSVIEGLERISSDQYDHSEVFQADLELPLFDITTIANATDKFSPRNKIGEGGFGPVYKGLLTDGQEIAVKRLSKYSIQGPEEFKNEVICIAKVRHRNLVRLLGCCIQEEEMMLIYEYMPNNSLDYFIFDQYECTSLDWPKRFHIIKGIARGLLYLHQDSPLRIIHRDLKASNILLDIDMNPKISDFGMARSFGGNETEANTKRVVGTYGYMSPEYAVDGVFSVKSDVFSFGVLVLEIITGKRNRRFFHPDHHHNLLGHAWILHKEDRSLELINTQLRDSYCLPELLRSIHVSLLCVQLNPEDRPNMSEVVLMLSSEGTLPCPKEPGFFTERNLFLEADTSSGRLAKSLGNELSITLLDGR